MCVWLDAFARPHQRVCVGGHSDTPTYGQLAAASTSSYQMLTYGRPCSGCTRATVHATALLNLHVRRCIRDGVAIGRNNNCWMHFRRRARGHVQRHHRLLAKADYDDALSSEQRKARKMQRSRVTRAGDRATVGGTGVEDFPPTIGYHART